MKHRSNINKTSLKIPSEIKYIREVSSKILKSLENLKVNESALFDIRLCVEETLRNAVVHGNQEDKKHSAKIDYWLEGNKFIVEIEDEGRGFDYKNLPNPTHEDNIMKASGRGIYLVRHLMDEVIFNDKGNKVRLTKYLK